MPTVVHTRLPRPVKSLFSLLIALVSFGANLSADTVAPFFKPGDVVALVGGEDMVALAEEGWLETLVTWAQPKDRIRFRSLAWEGDTVFEQRRDLNYPTLEAQLDKIGATVVICEFGKMESLAGKEGVAAFSEAYGRLIDRLNPQGILDLLNGRRAIRVFLVMKPTWFERPPEGALFQGLPDMTVHNYDLFAYYRTAIPKVGYKHHASTIASEADTWPISTTGRYPTRDGIHLAPSGQAKRAAGLAEYLGLGSRYDLLRAVSNEAAPIGALRTAIAAKNRMWFHYSRPQNWAFLNGDRTTQPSSRDHRDPSKRWFPEEMKQWLPLIDAKEEEIWSLAAQIKSK